MTENKLKQSTAVVARRDPDSDYDKNLDHFPTPAWATRALMEFLKQEGHDLRSASVLEPACGLGHMAEALEEEFREVRVSDVCDWGEKLGRGRYRFHKPPVISDFLEDGIAGHGECDWIITNPPFKFCKEFVLQSIQGSKTGCALLMRAAFLETKSRYEEIFKHNPPSFMLCFSERLGFQRNKVLSKTASATFHSWAIWEHGNVGRCQVDWIKPGSQKRLERPEDYDEDRIAGTEIETADLFEDE